MKYVIFIDYRRDFNEYTMFCQTKKGNIIFCDRIYSAFHIQRDYMTNEEFKQLLKKAGLNKKEFAQVAEISYHTVMSWGIKKTKTHNVPVPNWVKPFLENYIKAKTLDNVKDVICPEASSYRGDVKDG